MTEFESAKSKGCNDCPGCMDCLPSEIDLLRDEVERLRSDLKEWRDLAETQKTMLDNHWNNDANARKAHLEAEAEVERLRAAITAAHNELGVPQPGYPAPVANAAEILTEALEANRLTDIPVAYQWAKEADRD